MTTTTKLGIGVLFVALLFAGLLFFKPSVMNASGGELRLPELSQDGMWLNSQPLRTEDLQGKIVMIDIWEFTCVNCLRTLPYLKQWHEKYADDGLVIVGVHCPEFGFGRDSTNVARFVRANDIRWPIVLDNQFKIWTALLNRYWPRKMIFVDGKQVYDHIGEGGYEETERVIQELLSKRNGKTYPPIVMAYQREEDKPNTVCYPRSPEIYAGFERGGLGNINAEAGKIIRFPSEDSQPRENLPYLTGEWIQESEYLHYLGDQSSAQDRLTIAFTGNEVNAVLRSSRMDSDSKPILVKVTLDNEPVPMNWRGEDIKAVDGKEGTFIELREPRMYRILHAPKAHGEHILKLYPQEQGFELYAFTFGSCAAF